MKVHPSLVHGLTARVLFEVFFIEHLVATAQVNLSSLNVRFHDIRFCFENVPIRNDQGRIFLWSDGPDAILKLQDLRS